MDDSDAELSLNQSIVSPDSPQLVNRVSDDELLALPRTYELSASTLWRRRTFYMKIRADYSVGP
ncbi:hypothetical protein DM860_017674 [Cuscuta australis]|uniref:Uncharacterized protein n=1 Tax=Cuscuta australis TaxID=267555 RepID=A0A328D5X9_9ASTE|nr:hypothetical protein DM860_017674 [Cuscuta australis]